ncbi:hypothetical protein D9M72_429200 [compost metagenome]
MQPAFDPAHLIEIGTVEDEVFEAHPDQCRLPPARFSEVAAFHRGLVKIRLIEAGTRQVAGLELRLVAIRSVQVGATQVGLLAQRTAQVGLLQPGASERGARQPGTRQDGLRKIAIVQLGPTEIRIFEDGTGEIGAPQIHLRQVDARQVQAREVALPWFRGGQAAAPLGRTERWHGRRGPRKMGRVQMALMRQRGRAARFFVGDVLLRLVGIARRKTAIEKGRRRIDRLDL